VAESGSQNRTHSSLGVSSNRFEVKSPAPPRNVKARPMLLQRRVVPMVGLGPSLRRCLFSRHVLMIDPKCVLEMCP
jgi:hypothetical protein